MSILILMLFTSTIASVVSPGTTQSTQPVEPTPEGKWAFDQLASGYTQAAQLESIAAQVAARLVSKDRTERQVAARQVHALFKQSSADESNGRVAWKSLPYFGGGSESPARDFRNDLARRLSEVNLGEEAIEPARWLIERDSNAENQSAGMIALRHIQSPRVKEAFQALLSPPAHNKDVLVGVIEEAGIRGMKDLAVPIAALCGDYRAPIREAAIKQAVGLGFVVPAEFHPDKAFTSWVERELRDITEMVLTDIPSTASWHHFTVTEETSRQGDSPKVWEISGWLLEETADGYHVLDSFANDSVLTKTQTRMVVRTFKEEADDLVNIRSVKDDDPSNRPMERLSRRGGLTGQFEARFISVPEALVASWAFQRGDRMAAAKIIFPPYSDAPDERWVKYAVRDMLGCYYHDQLLRAFTHEREYAAALHFAGHLVGKTFEGYQYQSRARELVEQLTRRQVEDFKTLTLPTPGRWEEQCKTLSRVQQIDYLARRLRLLNCFQWGQPGGVSYEDEQTDRASRTPDDDDKSGQNAVPVINPCTELRKMKLEVRELPVLIPYLADEDFMLTYSYWRDFHPARTLHRVNWVVAEIVDSVAKSGLSDLKSYQKLDNDGKKQHLAGISRWVVDNRDKTRTQLLIQTISATKDFREFSQAAGELIQDRETSALPILLLRLADFRDQRAEMVEMCYRLDPDRVVDRARQWVTDEDPHVKLWAGLILLHSGDRAKLEGLPALRSVLQKDEDGDEFYPSAFDELLAAGQEEATKLACDVLNVKPLSGSDLHFIRGVMVHRLLLAGRQEAVDFLVRELGNAATSGSSSGEHEGKSVERQCVIGDDVARAIAEWRTDGYTFNTLAPDDQRAKEREKLKKWLTEQVSLIRQGKASSIKVDVQPLRASRWQVDAP